jgi:hypothetical protein
LRQRTAAARRKHFEHCGKIFTNLMPNYYRPDFTGDRDPRLRIPEQAGKFEVLNQPGKEMRRLAERKQHQRPNRIRRELPRMAIYGAQVTMQ